MALASVGELLETLRRLELLTAAQLQEAAEMGGAGDADQLGWQLVGRHWLTPFQLQMVCEGNGSQLHLGSYLLLEPLGQGGMGQVYRARHRTMRRVVALKRLHKDLLHDPDIVKRFYREITAVAQLSHPHVVTAYDAGSAGDAHFFVMEYVEGTDLAALVRYGGAVPVAQAVDYIRQAALGLQHIHENGWIHRDIKPHNLLLASASGMVKVADLGLARLRIPMQDGTQRSTITEEGEIMGTADFVAPEQSHDPRSVDIRADLYSLGCTLYYLLTGKPPFPIGGALEKVIRHRTADPTPVESLRPEVSPALARIVRKMMAKRPEDRFQTPGEAAAALASAHPSAPPLPTSTGSTPSIALPPPPPISQSPAAAVPQAAESTAAPRPASPPEGVIPWSWLGGAVALLLVLAGILALVIGRRS